MQKLNSLIEFFKADRKVSYNSTNIKDRLPSLIEELKDEKEKFINENLPDLKQLIKKNFKNLRISVLDLMQYNWNENTHSNILNIF